MNAQFMKILVSGLAWTTVHWTGIEKEQPPHDANFIEKEISTFHDRSVCIITRWSAASQYEI